jgi:ATP-independent RNA helicase DbpA
LGFFLDITDFASLPLAPELIAVAKELGFDRMTPIQSAAIPPLLEGRDLIGQSQTGSGKTAAFALPILNSIHLRDLGLQALILCPTRELATQVVGEIRKLGRKLEGLQILALVGGVPGREQAQALENGIHIAVGTPGRVLDLIDRGQMDFSPLRTLILDEADKMLELGFETELKAILKSLPQKRQTALFSATFPDSIQALSRSYQQNPVSVKIEDDAGTKPQIEQWVYEAEPEDKIHTLLRILQQHPSSSTVIFCNMKNSVHEIAAYLADQKVDSSALHGDLEQRERDRVMTMFRNGSSRILVATDIAARGLDIENLELVVNFDLPQQPETFVHRIGRTGRAGKKGVSVSLASPREGMRLFEIEKLTGTKFGRQALGFKNQHGLNKELRTATMQTLAISAGRKDKLRPGDILGALTKDAGFAAADIGKIEIQDKSSFVAVSSKIAEEAFQKLRDGRIKGKKYPVKLVQ